MKKENQLKLEVLVTNIQDHASSVKKARMVMKEVAHHYIEGKQSSYKKGSRVSLNSYTVYIDESMVPQLETIINDVIDELVSLEMIINDNFVKVNNKVDLNKYL